MKKKSSALRAASSRLVSGKTVARLILRSWRDKNGTHHNPLLVFTDGSGLVFSPTETEAGDNYGVTPLYIPQIRAAALTKEDANETAR